MGLSLDHAHTVPLILNLDTGAITPQFHVVFDDWFTTVTTSVDDLPDFNSTACSKMFGDSEYQFIRDEDGTQVDPEDFMTSGAITTSRIEFPRLWTPPCLLHPCQYLLLHLHLPLLSALPPFAIFLTSPALLPCCAFPINWCIISGSAPEGETTLGSAPATEEAVKTEDTLSPQPPQKMEPSSPTLQRSHRKCKQ